MAEDQLSYASAFEGERNLKFTGGDYLTGEAFVNATRSIDIPDTRNPETKDNLVLLRLLRESQSQGIRNDAIRVASDKIQARNNLLTNREKILKESTENVDQLYANNSVSVENVAAERARAIGYEPTETVQFYQTQGRNVGVSGQSAPYYARAAINGTAVQAQMIGYDRESGNTGVELLARTGPQEGQKVWLTQEDLGKEVLKQASEKLSRLKMEFPKQQERLFRELVPGKPVALYELSMPWYKLNGLIVEYENHWSTGTSYIGLMRYPDGTWAAAADIPAGNLDQLQNYVSKNWKNFVNDEPIRFQNGTETTLPPPTEAELILQPFRGTPEQIVNKSLEPLHWNINALERHVNYTLTEQIKELKTSNQYNLEELKARLPEFAQLAWDIGEGRRMEPDEVFLRGIIGGIEIVSIGVGAGGGIIAARKAAWKQKNLAPSTRQNVLNRGSSVPIVWIQNKKVPVHNSMTVTVGNRRFEAIEHNGKLYKLHSRADGKKKAIELIDRSEINAVQLCLSGRVKRGGNKLSCMRGDESRLDRQHEGQIRPPTLMGNPIQQEISSKGQTALAYSSDNLPLGAVNLFRRNEPTLLQQQRQASYQRVLTKLLAFDKQCRKRGEVPQPQQYAAIIRSFGDQATGPCNFYAFLVYESLDGKLPPGISHDILQLGSPGNHAFNVINPPRKDSSGFYPTDFSTWPKDSIIVDGWTGIRCSAPDYPQKWRDKMMEWNEAGIKINGASPRTAEWLDMVSESSKLSLSLG